MKKFEDIIGWQKGRKLCSLIYTVSNYGNFSKYFGLRDQIRRASVSIISNIAEGFERQSDKEFSRFLYIAKGSCGEVRSQLYIAFDLNYISETELKNLQEKSIEISKVLSGLITYLNNK